MMRTWSFYRLSDGHFTGRTFSTRKRNESLLAMNTPQGCAAIEGQYDHRSQRVDLATGQVVRDPDLEKANAENPELRRYRARMQIERLERQQARRVREILAASDPRLQAIDEQIAELRRHL